MVNKVYTSEMTWVEINELMPRVQLAIIPAGSTEQHGPHLPLQSDTAFCLYLCRRAARMVYPIALVTAPVSIGISRHHIKFAGSLSLRPETFIDNIFDIAWSMKQHGVDKIVIINGHGGNQAAVKMAARKIHDELGLTSAAISYWELLEDKKAYEILGTSPSGSYPGHASEFETSLSLVIQPEHVRKDRMTGSEGLVFPPYERFLSKSEIEHSKTGVPKGDPRLASREKGEKLIKEIVGEIASFLKNFGEKGYGQ